MNSLNLLLAELTLLEGDALIEALNKVKVSLHEISPFKTEPVDCVLWVKSEQVFANDYNPNSVAPPEMKLLELSIQEDGYTQPIVTMPTETGREVIDGFHRSRVAKESEVIRNRIYGYAPVVTINKERTDIGDRMAATVRHNRARGKHSINGMQDIVTDLKKRNWSDKKIGKHLGMDEDEVLRLWQIGGLAEQFKNSDFSKAWEPDYEFEPLEKIEDEKELS